MFATICPLTAFDNEHNHYHLASYKKALTRHNVKQFKQERKYDTHDSKCMTACYYIMFHQIKYFNLAWKFKNHSSILLYNNVYYLFYDYYYTIIVELCVFPVL